MKKLVLILILGSSLLSSCSYYTCPTYARKAVPVVDEKNEKI